ncbi:hypothetical protein [Robiginitalea sp. SC105]|uniref:hypothetical protein n=1 Tax=Robiginitalea sp. SC105 TaxID=2762332 RepID=UPI00163AD012|nr:hypothetical protein [Robiginitalea sp. SC105]MBC2839664.1 hypothetical protein [Robiginitalea sp. SC105]
MKTPEKSRQALTLSELMQLAAKLRENGFAPAHSSLGLSGQQLRGVIASFIRYRRSIRMALLVHLMFLSLAFGSWVASPDWYSILLCTVCFIAFLAFLGLALFHKTGFYEALGKELRLRHPLLGLLGLPLFFLMYPRYERGMREELSSMFRDLGMTAGLRPAH